MEKTTLSMDERKWVHLGSSVRADELAEASAKITEELSKGESLTKAQLIDATGIWKTRVSTALDEMVAAGFITKSGAGRKGDPFRFSAL